MKPGSIVLTLDPAAAYAGLLTTRDDDHPGRRAPVPPVDLPAAPDARGMGRHVRRHRRAAGRHRRHRVATTRPSRRSSRPPCARSTRPIIDVHWVTIKQLAQLEPTLVETVACMIGALLNEALQEAVNTMGVPEAAARSILYGHTQVALANGLRGDNPFSDACLIAMDYGRESIIKDDWKKIFRDDELDKNLVADAAPRPHRTLRTARHDRRLEGKTALDHRGRHRHRSRCRRAVRPRGRAGRHRRQRRGCRGPRRREDRRRRLARP